MCCVKLWKNPIWAVVLACWYMQSIYFCYSLQRNTVHYWGEANPEILSVLPLLKPLFPSPSLQSRWAACWQIVGIWTISRPCCPANQLGEQMICWSCSLTSACCYWASTSTLFHTALTSCQHAQPFCLFWFVNRPPCAITGSCSSKAPDNEIIHANETHAFTESENPPKDWNGEMTDWQIMECLCTEMTVRMPLTEETCALKVCPVQ